MLDELSELRRLNLEDAQAGSRSGSPVSRTSDGNPDPDLPPPPSAEQDTPLQPPFAQLDAPIPSPPHIRIPELKTQQAFLDALELATLENDDLPAHVLDRLRNPPKSEPELSPIIRLSLDIWLGLAPECPQGKDQLSDTFAEQLHKAR